jgi:hypothetical protein
MVASRSSISLLLGREFADSADVFQRGLSFRGVSPNTTDASAQADPFRANYAYLSWRTDSPRVSFSLGARLRDEHHEVNTQLDRRISGADADLSRRMTSRVTGYLHGAYYRDSFANTGTGAALRETSYGTGLRWQIRQGIALNLDLQHVQGNGSAGDTRNYSENRGSLLFSYGRENP